MSRKRGQITLRYISVGGTLSEGGGVGGGREVQWGGGGGGRTEIRKYRNGLYFICGRCPCKGGGGKVG
jgi:hypothetical protein